MNMSNQQKVQTNTNPRRPKKRKDMSTEERLQLLQRKLYFKAKQDRKASEDHACMVSMLLTFWSESMDSLIHIDLPANDLCMHEMNTTGKPYAGKPHVRFDEGAEERRVASLLYSTGLYRGTSP